MKYSELLQCEAIELRAGPPRTEDAAAARRLVASYVVSEAVADQLARVIFPRLRLDHTGDHQGLVIVGGRGAGKSHLLGVISALAGHPGLTGELAHAGAAGAATSMAGRFKVLALERAESPASLRDLMCRQFAAALGRWGISVTTPPLTNGQDRARHFQSLMSEFRAEFPAHGLLVIADELQEFLHPRNHAANAQDFAFLGEIGRTCQEHRFRFLAGLKAGALEETSVAGHALTAEVKHRFAQLRLPAEQMQFVAARRLAKKTPEQRARVREYLSGFTRCYGNMAARLVEFVDLFPVHPDHFAVIQQVQSAEPPAALAELAAAVRALLDTEVPQDRLTLISYDSYWEPLCRVPANRSIADVRAAMDCGRELEKRVPEVVRQPEQQALALRIIRALCVHRLTTLSVYLNRGLTPAELRDSLCLYLPPAATAGGSAADDLLAQIVAVFSELHERVPGRRLAVNPEDFQCYLHLSRFKRFVTQELVLHWVNAVPFLALLLTGAGMLASRFVHFDEHLLAQVIQVHKISAVIWIFALPLTVLLHPRIHWAHIREMLVWSRDDFRWMVQSLRNLHNDRAPLLPAGRFNPGQKVNACLVMLYFLGFVATGPFMHWQRSILFPWYVHTALFFLAAMSVGGHLFLAFINPSTRIALLGIFHGWTPLKYIKHHHALSLPEAAREHAPTIPANTIIQEVRSARRELALLALALGLFGVDVVAFSNWRIDLLKAHFEKSFADCIQPRALSTKHRLGKTAESCIKCHSYTGEIADGKCEACHENIKTRRTEQLGYHGTLKGECIHCHTEHPTETEAVVLLDTNKFDHALATFKRDGKHAQVACDECHSKKRTPATPGIYFIGLKHDSCTDCHRDPHARQFPDQCERCHTARGWTGQELKFAHDTDTSFPLTGKHQSTECRACHKPAKAYGALASATFKGLSHECASCHQEPHRKQFTAACTSCHTTGGWGREFQTFEHNRNSQFKLVAKHVDVACEKCHPPASAKEHLGTAKFRDLKQECADCHQEPHRGQFERACTRCHATPVGWAVASKEFKHDESTKYPLRGKHAAVDCRKCHPPEKPGGALGSAVFKGLDTRCETCHKVKHPREYGSACTACHTFSGWPAKAPGIGHIFKIEVAGENLTGRHLTATCDKCHDGARVTSLIEAAPRDYQCLTCHQKDDPHKGVLGTQCFKCHGMDGWKGNDLRFDHDTMANFSLDQDHRKVACAKCHTENRWKPLDARCESCHARGFLEKAKTPTHLPVR